MLLRAQALRATLLRNRRLAVAGTAAVLLLAIAGAGALMLAPSRTPSPTLRTDAVAGGSATAQITSTTSGEPTASDGPSPNASLAPGTSATPGPTGPAGSAGPTGAVPSQKPGTRPTPKASSTPVVTTKATRLSRQTPWTTIWILLSPGDVVTVEASGSYRLSSTGTGTTVAKVGCKGAAPKSGTGFPAPKLTDGALVGRMGGQMLCIGAGTKLTAGMAGYLDVTINDNTKGDDSGLITVKVTVVHQP